MKKVINFFSLIFVVMLSATIFVACDAPASGTPQEPDIPVPTEIMVEGYNKTLVVGEEVITKLVVTQNIEGEWEGVAKADYEYSCAYDGTKYGKFEIKVQLKEYPNIKFTDTITVNPIGVKIPSFTTVYTGETIDIKTELERNSKGLYKASKFTNKINVGEYDASLTLVDPNKYAWIEEDGSFNTYSKTKSIKWTITKAPSKTYEGNVHLSVYYGDTLEDVAIENGLTNITWQDGASTKVSNQKNVIAIYNENPQNYEDTPITFFFDEIITTSKYKIEYYIFDGTSYALNSVESIELNGNIGTIVNAEIKEFSGYELNEELSLVSGRILKKDGLVLKLYYDEI